MKKPESYEGIKIPIELKWSKDEKRWLWRFETPEKLVKKLWTCPKCGGDLVKDEPFETTASDISHKDWVDLSLEDLPY